VLALSVLGTMQAASAATNLALTGTASQSSTYPSGEAWQAIDGNTNSAWFDGSVAHSGQQDNPWWQVRLAEDAAIDSVVLWNRTDCCSERLSNVWLTLWQDNQQVASQWIADAPAPTASYAFSSVLADTVRLDRIVSNDDLQVAEVQVFGQVAAVPKPQTWALMAGGLAGLAGLARRRAAR
jgi:hypothetical protein